MSTINLPHLRQLCVAAPALMELLKLGQETLGSKLFIAAKHFRQPVGVQQ